MLLYAALQALLSIFAHVCLPFGFTVRYVRSAFFTVASVAAPYFSTDPCYRQASRLAKKPMCSGSGITS